MVFLFAGACSTGAMLPPLAPGPLRVSAPAHASRAAVLQAWRSGLIGECAAVDAHLAFAEHFEEDAFVLEELGDRIAWECQAVSASQHQESEGGSP